MLSLIHLQTQGNCRHIGCVDHNERPQEVVPKPDEGKKTQHGERRFRQRQDELKKDAEAGTAVKLRSLFQLNWNTFEELPKEEGPKGGECHWQYEGLIRVYPPQILYQEELRNHEYGLRNHQCGQVAHEDEVSARKPEPSKGIRGHTGREQDQNGATNRNQKCVEDKVTKWKIGPRLDKISPLNRGRNEGWRELKHLAIWFQRRIQHPKEGK